MLATVVSVVGAFVATPLAARWRRPLLALAAILIGVVASHLAVAAVALAYHLLDPVAMPPGSVLATIIGKGFLSLFIAPVAAFIGWRMGRPA